MTPSDSEKLETPTPCPHCGAQAVTGSNFEDGFYVMCSRENAKCGAMIGWQKTQAEAITAWNTRAPDSDRQQGGVEVVPNLGPMVERLRKALNQVRPVNVLEGKRNLAHVEDDETGEGLFSVPRKHEAYADLLWEVTHCLPSVLAALTTQPVPVDASAAKGERPFEARAVMLTKKHGDPCGTDYEQGQNDMGHRMVTMARDADRAIAALQPVPAPDSGSLSPASGWRGIETAPKDGTEIIVYRDGWQEAPRAKWGDHDGEDENDKPTVFGGWFLASEWHTYGCEDGFLGWNEDIADGVMPTHWMPLPPANSEEPG